MSNVVTANDTTLLRMLTIKLLLSVGSIYRLANLDHTHQSMVKNLAQKVTNNMYYVYTVGHKKTCPFYFFDNSSKY